MPNSIHNAPGQPGVPNGPPDTSPQENTGESEIDYQPNYSTHSRPVYKRNDNNPVPWVVLPGFYNEGKHDCHSKARITKWVDKIDYAPEPISVCLHFQFALLSTLLLVWQVVFFSHIREDSNRIPGYWQS
jgi:hypothetical protein